MAEMSEKRDAQEKPTGKNRGEQALDIAERASEFFEKDKGESGVVHCPKCHEAEKSAKFGKMAAIFSLGAFAISIASLFLQFTRAESVDMEKLQDVMSMFERAIENDLQESSSSSVSSFASESSSSSDSVEVQMPRASNGTSSSVKTVVAQEASASSSASQETVPVLPAPTIIPSKQSSSSVASKAASSSASSVQSSSSVAAPEPAKDAGTEAAGTPQNADPVEAAPEKRQ